MFENREVGPTGAGVGEGRAIERFLELFPSRGLKDVHRSAVSVS